MSSYLEQDSVPPWQQFQPRGLQYVATGVTRDPGAHEEAFTFVKASVLKLDDRLRRLLHEVWERQGQQVARGDVPDLLQPLRKGVRSLLPHLDLAAVDASDEQNLRVPFRRIDGPEDAFVELDDLSSGEKSVVGLLLPLVEGQIEQLLNTTPRNQDAALPTAIIDEPESHLHPSLQVLLVEYLSELAATEQGQYIIATQSPTIVDVVDDEALFLLAPAAAVPEGNQLVHMGYAHHKLEIMRSLTGSTHLLTRCRPIVFIEGERPSAKPIADQRLVELLVPEAKGWVLVAAHGRADAARSARQLGDAVHDTLPGVPVFALVDKDQEQYADDEHVISWPAAMIENLLLDSDAIWEVLAPHQEQIVLRSAQDVVRSLHHIASSMVEDEVRLRVPDLQKPIIIRLRARNEADVVRAFEQVREDLDVTLAGLSGAEGLASQFQRAVVQVQAIVNQRRELEMFRGKEILKAFHAEHCNSIGLNYKAFAYAVAREAVNHPRLRRLTEVAVRRLERFVPQGAIVELTALIPTLPAGPQRDLATTLLERLRAARSAWELDGNVQEDFEDLRRRTLELADRLKDSGKTDRLLSLSAQFGFRSAVLST